MKKNIIWSIILIVVLLLVKWVNDIKDYHAERENIVRQEMQSYLNEKYPENMIVKSASISDIKVGSAYVGDRPDITFHIFDCYDTKTDFYDTYLSSYLQETTEEYIQNELSKNGYNIPSISLICGMIEDELFEYYKKYNRPVMFYELNGDISFGSCTVYYDNLNNDDFEKIYKLIDGMNIPISRNDDGSLCVEFIKKS